VFLPGGNLRLLQGLAKDIPIMYSTPARLLQYCESGVRATLPITCSVYAASIDLACITCKPQAGSATTTHWLVTLLHVQLPGVDVNFLR